MILRVSPKDFSPNTVRAVLAIPGRVTIPCVVTCKHGSGGKSKPSGLRSPTDLFGWRRDAVSPDAHAWPR